MNLDNGWLYVIESRWIDSSNDRYSPLSKDAYHSMDEAIEAFNRWKLQQPDYQFRISVYQFVKVNHHE